MSKIYFRRIVAGAVKLSEVPERWHEETHTLLVENGYEDLCNE